MGTTVSKEMLESHFQEVKGHLKTVPVMSWVADNPWKSLGLCIGAKVVLWDWLLFRIRNKNLPPGPMGLPLFGSSGYISNDMGKSFKKVGDKYGEIVYLRMPRRDIVVLNTHQAIKQAFVKQASDFSDRPLGKVVRYTKFDDEIFTQDYNEEFKANKKFAVNALRSFGFGTKSLEGKIQAEIDRICEALREKEGEPTNPSKLIMKGMANVICSILFSKTWALDDPESEKIFEMISGFFAIFIVEFMLLLCPHSVEFLIGWIVYGIAKRRSMKLRNFIQDRVREHQATFDPNNLRDFVDVYINDARNKNPSMAQIADTTSIFFPDAIHTVSAMMLWVIVFAVANPEVQEKIQKEIDEKVGASRNPSENDKLDYTQAVVREAMRVCDLIDFLPFHIARQDTDLLGYRIPKGVEVMANSHIVHFDPEIYPEPDKFKPEHFLDEEGNLVKDDRFLTFGLGPRMCMGEKLAKQEIFLVIANLFQKFTFKFPEDKPAPTMKKTVFGTPEDFEIIATPR